MLHIKDILEKTECEYIFRRPEANGLHSEQIKALAIVLVEEINKELSNYIEKRY